MKCLASYFDLIFTLRAHYKNHIFVNYIFNKILNDQNNGK